jgi:hypothetical protein
MSLDVLPTVVDKEHARVECHWRLSREEGINPPAAGGGKKPVTQTLQFDSTLEMRFGRTMVVSGGRSQPAKGEKGIVVLVKAKLFDGKVGPKEARDIPDGLRTAATPKANEPSAKAPAAKPAARYKPAVRIFDKDDSPKETANLAPRA